jgi:hypothetical protein
MDMTPKKRVLRISPVCFLYNGVTNMHDLFCVDSVWYANFPQYLPGNVCNNLWYTPAVDNNELFKAVTDGNITFTFTSEQANRLVFTFGKNNEYSATFTLPKSKPRVLLSQNGHLGSEYDAANITFIQRMENKTVAEAWAEYFSSAA